MNKFISALTLLASICLAAFPGATHAAAVTGQKAPDFTLTDITGQQHTLSSYQGKTVVLEWVNAECPFVVKHYESGNVPGLQKDAARDGIVWLLLNSARPGAQGDYAPDKATAWMKKNGAQPAAYFRDAEGTVGRLYGAKTTPHMFVITADGTLVYDGAIDSIRSAKQEDIAKATNHVKVALAAIKEGKPVSPANTQPYGCSVKY